MAMKMTLTKIATDDTRTEIEFHTPEYQQAINAMIVNRGLNEFRVLDRLRSGGNLMMTDGVVYTVTLRYGV